MKQTLGYFAVLAVIGAGWGLTQPLMKIAVSTGYQPFGLIVWQSVVAVVLLSALTFPRGRRLPLARRYLLRYLVVALVGAIIPNSISYKAAEYLPAGILSIVISLVPMFALPLAIAIKMERFSAIRLLGVSLGAVAILMLALPKSSLPNPSMAIWVLFLALSPLMYAIEGTWVAKVGLLDLDPVQFLLGAVLTGLIFAVPLAYFSGQWVDITQPWGRPLWALLGLSIISALVYSAYVWLISRAGSVFAAQVSYLVTGFGILWAILLLSESYSGWVWGALAVMMAGLFLVRPQGGEPLVSSSPTGDNAP